VRLSSKTRREVAVAESAGATIRRITSLGFTDQEAAGWYRNHSQTNWLLRVILALFAGLCLLVCGIVFANYLESSLMSSMLLQPFVYLMMGVSFSYASYSVAFSGLSVKLSIIHEAILRKTSVINRHGVLPFGLAIVMIYFWSLPSSFHAALSNNMTHFMMYLTFVCAGGLVLTGITLVSRPLLMILSVAFGKILGLYGAFLILSPRYLYDFYPAAQQADTGVIMISVMTVIDMIILPCWLYRYFRAGVHIRQS